ncbi:Kelch repeat-containing protein [Pseudonocardia acaciae]|uniref:Kelch repeat-containing protein n=1 Tax=Pseudonocardia acaciae TaxID=551276 RepID=UPI00048EB786|nr:kelch repeat-containing protein [Pseudonocardia acaciae]
MTTATAPWTSTGELPVAGSWYGQYDGAVLLTTTTKKVLLVGGADGRSAALDQAVRYDTAEKKWSPAGKLQTARRLHTATVLKDGNVLVAGGIGGPSPASPALATAEVYNPATNAWETVGSMNEGRYGHCAVLVGDQVLVAGGTAKRSDDTVKALTSVETYDPAAKKWTTVKPMTDARTGHTAVAFKDGRVLVCGGTVPIARGADAALAFCELYNPTSKAWTTTANLPEPRARHQALALSDTTALVIGGSAPGAPGDGRFDPFTSLTAELYNLNNGTWTTLSTRPGGRGFHRAVALGSGKVLVIGGTGEVRDDVGYQSVLVFDSAAKTWTPVGGLAVGRWAFAATALDGGKVLVAGGTTGSGLAAADPDVDDLTRSTEVYTP